MKIRSVAMVILSVAALVGSTPVLAEAGQAGLQPAAQAQDELTYTMPASWVAQGLQGGPELKAHYVYMSGGRIFGEMFLTQTAAAPGQTLDQLFEAGLAQARPQMPYYQAGATSQAEIGGVPAIVHEFVYQPNSVGVWFAGRTYVMLYGSSVFMFSFQALKEYAGALTGECNKVMATVKAVPKPAPAPLPAADKAAHVPAPDPTARDAARAGGGLAAEDMGLAYTLPAGWRQVDDPMGAKYRLYGAGGSQLASLVIFKPESAAGLTEEFGGTEDDTISDAFTVKQDREFKLYKSYAPVKTAERKIGGYDGLVHDFTYLLDDNRPLLYRWVIFVVPGKSADPNVHVAPTIQPFAFMSSEPARAEELKRQWDAIIDSMRIKGAPAPAPVPDVAAVPPAPADKEGRFNPPPRPLLITRHILN